MDNAYMGSETGETGAMGVQEYPSHTTEQEFPHAMKKELPEPYVNVGNAERWISGIAGAALAIHGLRKDSWMSKLGLAALGGGLMYRGATGHCDCYKALGINTVK